MSKNHSRLPLIALLAAIGGCAVTPTGPNVMVLPGSGMSFEQFQVDDGVCRQFALGQVEGRSMSAAAQESAATSAAIGAAVGALAGVAIGGNSRGAAVGAGSGLLLGTAVGSDSARASSGGTQRQYDNAYIQCMYAKGHRVPVPGNLTNSASRRASPAMPPPPPAASAPAAAPVADSESDIPPPPPGSPPAPPPR